MRITRWTSLLCAGLLLAACSNERAASAAAESSAGPAAGKGMAQATADVAMRAPEAPTPTASLAYEHEAKFKVAAKDIAARLGAAQAACLSQSIGACEVLAMQQTGGDFPTAFITVRTTMQGVDQLIARAGQGVEAVERSTHAEDLAPAVADNQLRSARLQKEHARLLAYQDRPGLKAAELMEMSQQLATIEAQLDVLAQESAQQQRRITTQLLTLRFETTALQANRSEIGDALRDSGNIMTSIVAGLIRVLAALIPLSLLVLAAWLVLRRFRPKRVD